MMEAVLISIIAILVVILLWVINGWKPTLNWLLGKEL